MYAIAIMILLLHGGAAWGVSHSWWPDMQDSLYILSFIGPQFTPENVEPKKQAAGIISPRDAQRLFVVRPGTLETLLQHFGRDEQWV